MKEKDFRPSVANHKLPYQPIIENETYFYRSLKATQISKEKKFNTFQKELNEIIKAYSTL